MTDKTNHPIVFISYSWDTENGCNKHKEWVYKLATDLRHHGVDAIFDQFYVRLGDDLPFFIEQGLSKSHLVLCICSENYVKKANNGSKGVGYEKRILASELLNDTNKNFIIPVIKNNHSSNKVPTFLKGILYIDFDNNDEFTAYKNLLERIYDVDINKIPPLGTCPFHGNSISDRITTKENLEQIKFHSPNMEGKVSFDYKQHDGLFTIGINDYSFITKWSECGTNSIYCYKDKIKRIGYNPSYSDFPKSNELVSFNYSSRVRTLKIGEIIILENNYNKFAAIKILNVVKQKVDINHLLEFEYKIYTIL